MAGRIVNVRIDDRLAQLLDAEVQRLREQDSEPVRRSTVIRRILRKELLSRTPEGNR